MGSRREFVGIAAGAAAAMGLTPELLRALDRPRAKLIERAIPSSGEMLPSSAMVPGRWRDRRDPGLPRRRPRMSGPPQRFSGRSSTTAGR